MNPSNNDHWVSSRRRHRWRQVRFTIAWLIAMIMKADIDKTTAFPIYSLLMPSWDGDSIIPLKVASNTLATTSNPKSPLATTRKIHGKYKIKLTTTISSSSSGSSSSGNSSSSSSYSSNSSNSNSITSSLYSLWILRIIKKPLVFIANLQHGAFRLGNHSKIVMGAFFLWQRILPDMVQYDSDLVVPFPRNTPFPPCARFAKW